MTAPITPLHIALAHHLLDEVIAGNSSFAAFDRAVGLLEDDDTLLPLIHSVLSRLSRTAPKSVQDWLSSELGVSLPAETHETANETATQPYPTP